MRRKIRLEIELDYDATTMHGDDKEALAWFRDYILCGNKGKLLLHSNEIGDTVGKVNVLRIVSPNGQADARRVRPPKEQHGH
jgi:hypothetical protein